ARPKSPNAEYQDHRRLCGTRRCDHARHGAGLADPTGDHGVSVRRGERGGCPGTPVRITPLRAFWARRWSSRMSAVQAACSAPIEWRRPRPTATSSCSVAPFMVLNQALYKKPLYNAATDFAPVALVVEQPVVLIARKDFPANDLSEFIAYARTNQ